MEYNIQLFTFTSAVRSAKRPHEETIDVATVTPSELHDACFQLFEFVKQHDLQFAVEVRVNGRTYESMRELHDKLITPINKCSLAAGGCRVF